MLLRIFLAFLLLFQSVGSVFLIEPAAMAHRPYMIPSQGVDAQTIDSNKIDYTLKDLSEQTPATDKQEDKEEQSDITKTASASPLSEDKVRALFNRLPALQPAAKKQPFVIPEQSLVKPHLPGKIVEQKFPPDESQPGPKPERPTKANSRPIPPLKVLRINRNGVVTAAEDIAIQFSQPMVAVGDVSTVNAAANIPVKMTPATPGHWFWSGTQTLLFHPEKPKTVLPNSTAYKIEIPAGTPSAVGGKLATEQVFSFSTVTLNFSPGLGNEDQSASLEPMVGGEFDQDTDASVLLSKTYFQVGKQKTRVAAIRVTPDMVSDKYLKESLKSKPNRFFLFKPASKLPKDTDVSLVIAPGLISLEGPLRTTPTFTLNFHTYGPLKLSQQQYEGDAESGLVLSFTNPLATELKSGAPVVHMTPPVKNQKLEVSGNSLVVRGEFVANSKYSAALSPSIKDIFGQTYSGSQSVPVLINKMWPSIELPINNSAVATIPTSREAILPVTVRGSRSVEYSIREVQPAEFSTWINRTNEKATTALLSKHNPVLKKTVAVNGGKQSFAIDLKPFLKNGFGHFLVQITPTNYKDQQYYSRAPVLVWIQVTGLNVKAIDGLTQLIVEVKSVDEAKPLSNVDVTPLFAHTKASGKTNASGLAKFETANNMNTNVIIAKKGDDSAILSAESIDSWGFKPMPDATTVCAFTDRGLYKQSEIVHVKGFVRRAKLESSQRTVVTKRSMTVDWECSSQESGESVKKGSEITDSAGAFSFDLQIPEKLNLGTYIIKFSSKTDLDDSNLTFTVMEFRKPEFEMKVTAPESTDALTRQAIRLDAKANYYTGEALKIAPITWTVSTEPAQYSPPNWSDYTFSPTDFYGWESSSTGPGQTLTTDANGESHVSVEVGDSKKHMPVKCTVEASVKDVNNQTWTGSQSLLFHPSKYCVGLRPSWKDSIHAKEQIKFNAVLTNWDGKTVENKKVHLRLERLENEDKPTLVEELEVVSQSKPLQLAFKPLTDANRYRIVASASDESERLCEAVETFNLVADVSATDERITDSVIINADKHSYQVGDIAKLEISTPWDNAHGILLVEKLGLVTSIPLAFKSTTNVVEVPVTENMLPKATVSVYLDAPGLKMAKGTIDLDVPPAEKQLNLEIKPDSVESAPGSDNNIQLTLTDKDGKPVSDGQITVAVIDEAILETAKYDWPNPLDVFFKTFFSDVRTGGMEFVLPKPPHPPAPPAPPEPKMLMKKHAARADAFGGMAGGSANKADLAALPPPGALPPPPLPAQAPMLQGATNGTIGPQGPDATPIQMRTNFGVCALFNAQVLTDAEGKASVKVHLPDSLTRYRVMAVAAAGDDQFGSKEAQITVRLPLMIRPSAPRFLNLGDKFEMPVVIQNQTDEPQTIDVGIRGDNIAFTDSSSSGAAGQGKELTLPAHEKAKVTFNMTTSEVGPIHMQCGASSTGGNDASEFDIPVLRPASAEAFAAYGQIDDGAALQKIQAPKDVLPDFGGLNITTSSTAMQSLTDAYIYLRDYHFECSEQISSRVLAMLALKPILVQFGSLKESQLPAYNQRIKDDIGTLYKRQRDDGSFGLWTRNEGDDYPYVNLQVTRALNVARTMDYKIDDAVLSKANDNIIKHPQGTRHQRTRGVDYSLRAYSLFIQSVFKLRKDDAIAADAAKLVDASVAEALKTQSKNQRGKVPPLNSSELKENLPIEPAAWLLPVLSKTSSYKKQTDIVEQIISGQLDETASTASVRQDSLYGGWNYFLFCSPNRASGVVLDSMILAHPDSDLIPKLAKGLLAKRRAGAWEGTQENCVVLLALQRYFSTYEKNTPNFDAQTWLGETFVGSSKFEGRSTESKSVEIPLTVLKKTGDTDLLINKVGKGRLYYRVGLDYVPSNLAIAAADYGFTVSRKYEAVDKKSDVRQDADGTWHFKAGSTIKVNVEFSSPGDRYHVALMDPLPAGAEPLNPDLAGTRSLVPDEPAAGDDAFNEKDGSQPKLQGNSVFDFLDSWWHSSWYDHQNLRDHQAEAFAALLSSGTHTYTYKIQATTPGTYIIPPTKVEEMYMPETFGRTKTEHVIIE